MKHQKYKDVWTKSFGTEIHRLATTMETILFVYKEDILNDRKGDETYARIVSVYREGKKDKYRTHVTMGGNLVNFPGDCGTPTVDLLRVKLLLNSIISTKNEKFMTLDIKDFYLMTPMKRYEYFRMKLNLFPQDIIDEYKLTNKVDQKGNVHCEVQRGMYALPQAGIITQDLLEERLKKAHQAIGSTNGNPSASHLSWTTLALSTLERNTSCISSRLSKNTTKWKRIGKDSAT